MGRTFQEHKVRRVHSLDGQWRFATDEKDEGKALGWQNGLKCFTTVAVPQVWNSTEGLLTYEGVCWYERDFYTCGGTIRLCFGAVLTEAEVYLDGILIGSHYGGFTAFDFIVDISEGTHRLTLRADNRFDAHSIPQKLVDWYHYGGIIRSVTMEELNGACVLSARFDYELNTTLSAAVCHFTLKLFNTEKAKIQAHVTLHFENSVVFDGYLSAPAGVSSVALPDFTVSDLRLWDEGKGELYTAYITTDTDDLTERVGFRKVEVKDSGVYLNNRRVEFRGVNRHEDHPDWGFAFPFGLMNKDLDLIERLGCNSVRGSHYPNSKELVDLLDERGLMFWSEIPIWGCGFSVDALADPIVVERGLEMHREMLEQYYNHPSIVIWGMHNEIDSRSQAGYDMTEKYYAFLKQNGGNRLVSFASRFPLDDICFGLCDIVSINYYIGWYQEHMSWKELLIALDERLAKLDLSQKPIIMSEFGAAALYGCHDDENIRWSEEYQAKLLSDCVTLFHEHPSVVGSFIWQFADMRTCWEAGMNRARGFNNKGIMNEYRKPKLAYREIKRLYNSWK